MKTYVRFWHGSYWVGNSRVGKPQATFIIMVTWGIPA
jgi:hypothetical protein